MCIRDSTYLHTCEPINPTACDPLALDCPVNFMGCVINQGEFNCYPIGRRQVGESCEAEAGKSSDCVEGAVCAQFDSGDTRCLEICSTDEEHPLACKQLCPGNNVEITANFSACR